MIPTPPICGMQLEDTAAATAAAIVVSTAAQEQKDDDPAGIHSASAAVSVAAEEGSVPTEAGKKQDDPDNVAGVTSVIAGIASTVCCS